MFSLAARGDQGISLPVGCLIFAEPPSPKVPNIGRIVAGAGEVEKKGQRPKDRLFEAVAVDAWHWAFGFFVKNIGLLSPRRLICNKQAAENNLST